MIPASENPIPPALRLRALRQAAAEGRMERARELYHDLVVAERWTLSLAIAERGLDEIHL